MSSLQGTKDSWLNDPTRMPTLEPFFNLIPPKAGLRFLLMEIWWVETPVFHVMIWGSSNWNKLFEVDVSGIKSKCIGFPRHPGQYNWQVWNPRVNEGVRVLRYPAPLKKWIHSKRLQGKNTKSKAATLSFFLYPFDSFEGKSVQPRRPLENVPNIELFFQLKKSTAEVSDFARKHELAFRVLCPTKRSTFLCERSSHNASDLFAVLTGQDKCMWRRLKTLPEGCDRFWHVPRLVSMLAREQAYFTNPYDTSNQHN